MNSILQALIHNSPFINIFFKEYRSIKNQDISEALLDLIYLASKEEYTYSAQNIFERSSWYSFSPIKFKNAFSSKHTQFQIGQQDAIEILRILLVDINKENNSNRYFVPYRILETVSKTKEDLSREYHNLLLTKENSIIINTFYIQLINSFRCQCKYLNLILSKKY